MKMLVNLFFAILFLTSSSRLASAFVLSPPSSQRGSGVGILSSVAEEHKVLEQKLPAYEGSPANHLQLSTEDNSVDQLEELPTEKPAVDQIEQIDTPIEIAAGKTEVAANNEPNPEIAHLQKKLRYWKSAQKTKEEAYQQYLIQHSIEHAIKPIYVREGKIDTYKVRPIFNERTDSFQTEIWSIKEQIKLTNAKLTEERRVQKIKEEVEHRLRFHDADIRRLQELAKQELEQVRAQLQYQHEGEMKSQREHAESDFKALKEESNARLRSLQEQANEEQRMIKAQHEANMKRLKEQAKREQEEADAVIKSLQDESSRRLTEKERAIDSLAKDINTLAGELQVKRKELQTKDSLLSSLQSELETKESILETLERERESLRCMLRRSWNVLKDRVQRRVHRGEKGSHDDEDGIPQALHSADGANAEEVATSAKTLVEASRRK
jgi:DNA repair exonuclease SbcCD ATPase subunit